VDLKKDSAGFGTINRAWLVEGGGTSKWQGSYALNGYFYTKSPYAHERNIFKVEADVRALVKPLLCGLGLGGCVAG